ncbi:MAG: antiactivator of flagellar biosynthesis FleN protein, partial [Pseudomonadota bacterium]|nr:antiactivator of flagellar biosynthesis FleN protein [Pseudomonadota bacterium]
RTAQGFSVATMTRETMRGMAFDADQSRRLANAFAVLAGQSDILLIDAELDADGGFPVAAMQRGDIVVQVANNATSITAAYAIIKRVCALLGRRQFGILVTGASASEARQVYENMAQVASRYLAVPLVSVGWVPADADLKRANDLGRAVIDAFPMAGAAVAFRRLAGHFVNAGAVMPALV